MSIDTSNGHKEMDYPEHVRTYNGFIQLAKITVVFLVVLLAGMAMFLVKH